MVRDNNKVMDVNTPITRLLTILYVLRIIDCFLFTVLY